MKLSVARILSAAGLVLGAALVLRFFASPPEVTVGVLYSDCPPYLATEVDMLSTAQAYVDWYNGKGGPIRLRLAAAHYRRDPAEAFEELCRRKVSVVLAGSVSELAEAAASHAERLRIPLVSPTAQTEKLQGRDDWFFRVQKPLSRTVERTAALLCFLEADRVIAFVSDNNEAYALETVRRTREAAGLTVEIVDADGDFASRRTWMASIPAPPAVWIVAAPETSFWICRQVRELWPESALILSIWSLSSGHGRLDEIDGLSFFFVENFDPWLAEDRGEDPFRDAFRSAYRHPLSMLFHYTAAAMDLIAAAAEEKPRARGESFRRALAPRSITRAGWSIALDAWGDPQGSPRVFRRTSRGVEEVFLP